MRSYKNNKNSYPGVGMIREVYGEIGYRVLVTAVMDRCKHFGTIVIPSITITLTAGLLFRFSLLLFYKFSLGKSELE